MASAGQLRNASYQMENSINPLVTKGIKEHLLSLSEKINDVYLEICYPEDRKTYFKGDYEDLTMSFDGDNVLIIPHMRENIKIIDDGEMTFAIELNHCKSMNVYEEKSDFGFLKKPHFLIEIELLSGKNIYLYYNMK